MCRLIIGIGLPAMTDGELMKTSGSCECLRRESRLKSAAAFLSSCFDSRRDSGVCFVERRFPFLQVLHVLAILSGAIGILIQLRTELLPDSANSLRKAIPFAAGS